LDDLLGPKNGRLLPEGYGFHKSGKINEQHHISYSSEITEFHQANHTKINKQSDIYSIGAILYRLLLGVSPILEIAEHISKKRLHERSPELNVYEIPYFFKNYVLSNDMCFIIAKLLSESPRHRYQSLSQLRKDLVTLRENIFSTPPMLRRVLGHPILPQEKSLKMGPAPKSVDFRSAKLNQFSLKYLGKFIYEHNVESLAVNGGPMPLLSIKLNNLVELNLREQNLYSEDLFILSQFLKHNTSVTHINLSKNFIGYKYLDEAKIIELKMKNQEKLKDFSFE